LLDRLSTKKIIDSAMSCFYKRKKGRRIYGSQLYPKKKLIIKAECVESWQLINKHCRIWRPHNIHPFLQILRVMAHRKRGCGCASVQPAEPPQLLITPWKEGEKNKKKGKTLKIMSSYLRRQPIYMVVVSSTNSISPLFQINIQSFSLGGWYC